MMIVRLGGSYPAHTVSLHALTGKHNKTETMATSQRNSKVASSNWKYYFSLIEIKGNNVLCNMDAMPRKKDFIHVCLK